MLVNNTFEEIMFTEEATGCSCSEMGIFCLWIYLV